MPGSRNPSTWMGDSRIANLVGSKNLASGGIDAAVSGIAGVEGGDGCGLGIDARGDANGGVAGGVDGRPQAGANASKDCRAVGGAFFGFDDLHRVAIDVGLDLAPQGGARAAAAEADAGDGHVHFTEEGEGVAETEGHAFENGANGVGASVGGGQANERATSVGIQLWGALAHQ